ncbi:MAG: ATP-binding protein [Saprospiraceae bacterium]|nr:ATP-binding protein [Saprospiraceae bacterium]
MSSPRPFIVLTGPESSGKTTLAEQLSLDLGLPLVTEVAREILTRRRPAYTEADVYRMALAQWSRQEGVCRRSDTGLVVADTDLLTYRIWLEVKYNRCSSWVRALHHRGAPVHYLLCAPDLPWEPDPLREHEHGREALFERHLNILDQEQWPYTILKGDLATRREIAWSAIRDFLF